MRKKLIPIVDTEQMIEIDRLMTDCYGITLIQMMENAGRDLALLAKQMLGGEILNRKICVIAGNGNNGGVAWPPHVILVTGEQKLQFWWLLRLQPLNQLPQLN